MNCRLPACSILLMLVFLLSSVQAELLPVQPEIFFVEPNQSAALAWTIKDGAEQDKTFGYVVHSYKDEIVRTGKIKSAKNQIALNVNLPQGYYEVEFPSEKQRFGVVSLPAYQGEVDLFFGIDAALSWLKGGPDKDPSVLQDREPMIRILKRCGIGIVRERLGWGGINPEANKWDWETSYQYDSLRRLYVKHGIKILELFHDAPAWVDRPANSPYPGNLAGVMNSWQAIDQRWGGNWSGLEGWNEPDINFGGDVPADQNAPLLKTLAYTMRHHAKYPVPLGGGVVTGDEPDQFINTLSENGLLNVIDFFSFHNYQPPVPTIEEKVARYQKWFKENGREGLPIWITECGWPWKTETSRPSCDADEKSALFITMKAVEARACGVAKFFPFVYPYYGENVKNFGMMGKEITPLRSMVAYLQAILMLGNKEYLGDLKVGVFRARVFGNAEQAVVVLYSGDPGSEVKVQLNFAVKKIEGIDGRRLTMNDKKTILVQDGLVYVWVDRKAIVRQLVTDTVAMKLTQSSQTVLKQKAEPSPVILQPVVSKESIKSADRQNYKIQPENGKPLIIRVKVWNLSDQSRSVDVKLHAVAMDDLTSELPVHHVEVLAQGWQEVQWQVDAKKLFDVQKRARKQNNLIVKFRIEGTCEGITILPAMMNFMIIPSSAKELVSKFSRQYQLDLDPEKWNSTNVTAGATVEKSTKPDGILRMSVNFPEKCDPWYYPLMRIPAGLDLKKYEGVVLRSRFLKAGVVHMFAYNNTGSAYIYCCYAMKSGENDQWQTIYIPFSEMGLFIAGDAVDANLRPSLEKIDRISIGFNNSSPDHQNTLEISDLYLVGQ